MPLPIMLGGLMEDMQEQAEKVEEVIRAALDGKLVLTPSCERCYQDGQRDMLARCIAAVEDLFGPDDYELRWLLDGEAVLAALRALEEKT